MIQNPLMTHTVTVNSEQHSSHYFTFSTDKTQPALWALVMNNGHYYIAISYVIFTYSTAQRNITLARLIDYKW